MAKYDNLTGIELNSKIGEKRSRKLWASLFAAEYKKDAFLKFFNGRYIYIKSLEFQKGKCPIRRGWVVTDNSDNYIFGEGRIVIQIQRKKQISYFKNLAKNHNVLVRGAKGSGKTTIVKAAARDFDVTEIDLVKLDKKKDLVKDVYWSVNSLMKWKIIWGNKSKIIYKYFLPFLISAYTILVPVLTTGIIKGDFTKIIIWVTPLFVLSWFILKGGLALIYYIFHKKQMILVSELNYLESENYLELIWGIKKMFPKYKYVFETTNEIHAHIEAKFDLMELNVFSDEFVQMQFRNLDLVIKKLDESRRIGWDDQINEISKSNDATKILLDLSFGERESIFSNFYNAYKIYKGELNLMDFLILNYIKFRYPEIYIFYRKNALLFGSQEFEIRRSIGDGELKSFRLTKNKLFSEAEGILDIPEKRDFFSLNKSKNSKGFLLFDNSIYTRNYYPNGGYSYLLSEVHDEFNNNPWNFLDKLEKFNVNPFDIRIDYFTNKEIKEFLKKIDLMSDSEKTSISEHHDFFNNGSFDRVLGAIIKSRGTVESQVNFVKEINVPHWSNSFSWWIAGLEKMSKSQSDKLIGELSLKIKKTDFSKLNGTVSPKFNIRSGAKRTSLIDYNKFRVYAFEKRIPVWKSMFLGNSNGTDGFLKWWALSDTMGISIKRLKEIAGVLKDEEDLEFRIYIRDKMYKIKYDDLVGSSTWKQIIENSDK